MSETEQDLRATSDELLAELESLHVLEARKRTLDPADPALVELAGRIEQIAVRVLRSATAEHELTRQAEVEVAVQAPTAPSRSIDDTPPREASVVLAEWRAAERRAAAAAPGSPEAAAAAVEVERLRDEYRRVWVRS